MSFVWANSVSSFNGLRHFAEGINNKGTIVGFYGDVNGTNHGFLASEAPTPKVGPGVDTFVFAPTSNHDTNTLLAVQHSYTQLADVLHAGADIAHYAQDIDTPTVAHA